MRGGYPAFPTVDGPFDRAAKRIEKLATNIY